MQPQGVMVARCQLSVMRVQAEWTVVTGTPAADGFRQPDVSDREVSQLGAPPHVLPFCLPIHSKCSQSLLLRLSLCKTQLGFLKCLNFCGPILLSNSLKTND